MHKKIPAFTILEVTITMLVSALLIGITYTCYSIITKSYQSFNKKNDELAVVLSLDHLLKRDFDKADIILKSSDGIAITTSTQLIKYELNPAFIIRIADRIDTFKVQIQEVQTTFENLQINEMQEASEQNRIDHFGFTLSYQNERITFHYNKPYSSVNLINRNPNAIN